MSGDWIKMEVNLPEKPEIWQIAGICRIDPDSVVGKLLKVWRWFDAHTETGNALGVTYALVDHVSGVTGFGEAMSLCGWLEQDGSILKLPNFDRHNGKTAKNRALTAKRVASHKEKGNAKGNAVIVSDALPREEKRREEQKKEQPPIPPSGESAAAAIIAEYHEALPRCRRIAVLNPKRRKRIAVIDKLAAKVCTEQGWTYDRATFWRAYFAECAADPWLRGDKPHDENPSWKQSLDILIREDRFAIIMDNAIAAMRAAP